MMTAVDARVVPGLLLATVAFVLPPDTVKALLFRRFGTRQGKQGEPPVMEGQAGLRAEGRLLTGT